MYLLNKEFKVLGVQADIIYAYYQIFTSTVQPQ